MRFQLIRTYQGHDDRVSALAAFPDQARVASASPDGLIKIWDIRRNHSTLLRHGTDDHTTALHVFPGGFFLVSGEASGLIQFWNAETGEMARRLAGHTQGVTALAMTRSGKRLVSGSQDCTIRIWDTLRGACLYTSPALQSSIQALALSPDDRRVLVSAGERDACGVLVWDLETGECIGQQPQIQIGVQQMMVLDDGRSVLSASAEGDIVIWDSETGTPVRQIREAPKASALALMPGEQYLVVGTALPSLALWNLQTGEKIDQFAAPSDQIACLTMTSDGRYLVAGCRDGSLNFYMRVL